MKEHWPVWGKSELLAVKRREFGVGEAECGLGSGSRDHSTSLATAQLKSTGALRASRLTGLVISLPIVRVCPNIHRSIMQALVILFIKMNTQNELQ